MLCVNNYTKKYIEECRSRVTAQVSAYQALCAAAAGKSPLKAAIEVLEPHFFTNMVLTLECYFVHRARGKEGKDGNPLNEVRMLCNSIMNHDAVMSTDKTIKYDPAKSVLKHKIGEEVKVNEKGFMLLSAAFFAEIENKYL